MSEHGKSLLAKLKAQQADTEPVSLPTWDPDLVPDEMDAPSTDPDLDAFIENIDIIDAYNRWCGKMTPDPKGKRESIMISCPNPSHPDKDPSAWINLDKQTYFCGGCQQGGDVLTIAAYRFGYPVPEYQEKEYFPDLIEQIASDLGYVIKTTATGHMYVDEVPTVEVPAVVEADKEPKAEVIPLRTAVEVDEAEVDAFGSHFRVNWQSFVPEDTFLHEWMDAVTIDDLPHEYYLFLGLQALGCALGTSVVLDDYLPVKSNFFLCLYGTTASGKSRAIHPFVRLLREALPWDGDDFNASSGISIAPTPGSAEALHDIFRHEIHDPSDMKIIDYAQVRGLIKIDELASFAQRAARAGSTFKETLIELHDVYDSDIVMKTMGGGVRKAHNPFCQVLATTQPKAIHEFLSKSDEHSGFLNRWVIVTGKPRVAPISYGGVRHDLTVPINLLKDVKAWADAEHVYELRGEAYEAWDTHYRKNIVPLHESDEPILGRLDLLEKKLIILFAANQKLAQPTGESVERALKLHPYLLDMLRLFSSHIRSTEYDHCWQDVQETIIKYTKDKKVAPTRRQINQRLGHKYQLNQLTQVIVDMTKAGVVDEQVVKGARGPATVRYSIASA